MTCHSVDGAVIATLDHPKRVHSMQRTEGLVVTGCEDGSVRLWDLRAKGGASSSLVLPKAHSVRVRGLALPGLEDPTGGATPTYLATAASDGKIRLWDTRMAGRSADGGRDLGKWVGEVRPAAGERAGQGARLRLTGPFLACRSRRRRGLPAWWRRPTSPWASGGPRR